MSPWLRNAAKDTLRRIVPQDRFLWRLPAEAGKALALTFDDGPHPVHTPEVLDLLAEHGIKGTFFVIGHRVVRYPELVRRIAVEGHTLGNHTFGHREVAGIHRDDLIWELEACERAIQNAAGVTIDLFRPPRGKLGVRSLEQVIAFGYRVVHWSKTYSDYRKDGNDALLLRMQHQPVFPRDIVLLHDHNPFTVQALATMLPVWRSSGLRFQRL
ncbi:MAG: polysaccharide deacetylase family protein [Gammaproteobacteria bacterium]|nr:polysaccharide deacetylase family protein [Gammaproteobacteria bacterium]